jgi:hypothetical protein
MPDEWLTTNEAAEISEYHIDYIRKLLQADQVGARKF